jgi:pyruvate/2-oxoglutarate dehydrogenase complex dihydrolipoamide acyltransferase (E2) component
MYSHQTASQKSIKNCALQIKMSCMRLRISKHLKESQNAAALLTMFNKIDMSLLMEMRKKYKDAALKEVFTLPHLICVDSVQSVDCPQTVRGLGFGGCPA